MIAREFAELIKADYVLNAPRGSDRSALLRVQGERVFAYVFNLGGGNEERIFEEFEICLKSAIEHRLPLLVWVNCAYDCSSTYWVSAEIALLSARDTIPTAVLTSEGMRSASIDVFAAAFDLCVMVREANGKRVISEQEWEPTNVKCDSYDSASRVLYKWLKIVPASSQSVLLPNDNHVSVFEPGAEYGSYSSKRPLPAFWSESFVLQTFDEDSLVVFSDFKKHNIHAGMGLIGGIPSVFILPELARNEALITQTDAQLILRLLRFCSRFGIPVVFSIDAGPIYGVGGEVPGNDLLIMIAEVLGTMRAPLLVISREPISPRSSLIAHMALSRAEEVLVSPLAEDLSASPWRQELASRLVLGCRKFAAEA